MHTVLFSLSLPNVSVIKEESAFKFHPTNRQFPSAKQYNHTMFFTSFWILLLIKRESQLLLQVRIYLDLIFDFPISHLHFEINSTDHFIDLQLGGELFRLIYLWLRQRKV
jgi:hypothetical protein